MNLIKTLDDELSQMHLTDFEKARYIYLRCCEIFSFDARWYFTDLLDDEKTHESETSFIHCVEHVFNNRNNKGKLIK